MLFAGNLLISLVGIVPALALAKIPAAPIRGPYKVEHAVFENPLMDKTSRKIDGPHSALHSLKNFVIVLIVCNYLQVIILWTRSQGIFP